MKTFRINQIVVVPNGKKGKIKSIDKNTAVVWFDEDGLDMGYFSITTLQYVS